MRNIWMSLCVLFVGCASAPVYREVENRSTVDAPFAVVWDATVELLAERGYPIQGTERGSGLITSGEMSFGPRDGYADCGKAGLNVELAHTARFNVVVREAGEVTSVTVNAQYSAVREFGGAVTQVQCVSTGALEADLLGAIAERVGVP